MENASYFIWKALFVLYIFKFLYFRLTLFFCLSAITLEDNTTYDVYDVIKCLNKNLITHSAWYRDKKKRYDIAILSLDRVLNKEHFYGKIMQKICTKS